jgi:hypothetical protein
MNVQSLKEIKISILKKFIDKGVIYSLHAIAKGFYRDEPGWKAMQIAGYESLKKNIQGTS